MTLRQLEDYLFFIHVLCLKSKTNDGITEKQAIEEIGKTSINIASELMNNRISRVYHSQEILKDFKEIK